MDTTVKYFHSEMPGAPVLSGTAGALLAVLDACLVTGWGLLTASSASVSAGVCTLNFATTHAFEVPAVALVAGATAGPVNGEKRIAATTATSVSFPVSGVPDGPVAGTITIKLAPAGWVKAFSGTNKAAYKSSNASATGCLMRVDDTGARIARLRAFDAMTDVDTGTGATPTELQLAGGCYFPKSSDASAAARKWVVAATDSFVLINVAYSSSFTNDYALYAFGDIPSIKPTDPYRFFVAFDTSDLSGQGYIGNSTALLNHLSSYGCYFVRSHVGYGGAVMAEVRKPGLVTSSGRNDLPAGPSVVNNSLEVCPTLVYEGTGNGAPRRGVIPGVYGIPHYLGPAFDSKERLTGAVGLEGHTLMFLRFMTQSQSYGYRYAIDITGPWS